MCKYLSDSDETRSLRSLQWLRRWSPRGIPASFFLCLFPQKNEHFIQSHFSFLYFSLFCFIYLFIFFLNKMKEVVNPKTENIFCDERWSHKNFVQKIRPVQWHPSLLMHILVADKFFLFRFLFLSWGKKVKKNCGKPELVSLLVQRPSSNEPAGSFIMNGTGKVAWTGTVYHVW